MPLGTSQRQRDKGSQQSHVPLSQFPLQLLRIGGQEAVRPKFRASVTGLNHFVEHFTVGLLSGPAFHFHDAPAHRGSSNSDRHCAPLYSSLVSTHPAGAAIS